MHCLIFCVVLILRSVYVVENDEEAADPNRGKSQVPFLDFKKSLSPGDFPRHPKTWVHITRKESKHVSETEASSRLAHLAENDEEAADPNRGKSQVHIYIYIHISNL